MLVEDLVMVGFNLARKEAPILTEKIIIEVIRGAVVLGCGGLVYKGADMLSDKYNEVSIEGKYNNDKSIIIKGRR